MQDTLEQLMTFASEKFRLSKTDLNASDDLFETLKIDSVQALSLLSDLEMKFDVEIPDYELQEVKTFEDLADLISRRQA